MSRDGQSRGDTDRTRTPRYGKARVENYTREGMGEDQERVKIVRPKTVRTGTLKGEGVAERTVEQKLADFPGKNAYNVLKALVDEFNVHLEER